ncbi:MAG TPA: hypothetical protein VHU88_11330 [Sporichthyaceae bacterium]|nr:hypothetical protein [Sporichthyaceae bacterium]
MARRYKWIAGEIERLDPDVDYERIWALSSTYWVDEFMMSFLYSVSFPNFMLPANGGRTVGRGGTGPVITDPDRRQLETVHHFWTWFAHGPSSEHTHASVEQVNEMHRGISRRYPGDFGDPEDFVYTLCYLGAGYHRIRQLAGLPGYTNRQRIAAHRHWCAMAELFWTETGPVAGFPADFAAMLTFLDEWESRHQDWTPDGAACTRAVIEQFAARWFPRPLHFLGRAMLCSFYGEAVLRVHRLRPPDRRVVALMRTGMRGYVLAKEKLLPDPRTSTPDRHRSKKRGSAAQVADGDRAIAV